MSRIIMYHGTTSIIEKVDLLHTKHNKDFGDGFYTTTDANQAIKWARHMQGSNLGTHAYVYAFLLYKEELDKLTVYNLSDSMEWLRIVYSHRVNRPALSNIWDVVYGKVADALAQDLVDNLRDEYPDAEFYDIPEKARVVLLRNLHTERLHDQYCFRTQDAIQLLNLRKPIRKEIINGVLR